MTQQHQIGPIRTDGGPGVVPADHLILVRFPSGSIDVRETGPGRSMPDGVVEWRDLGHIAAIFPGARPYDCWVSGSDRARAVNHIPHDED